MNSYYTAYDNIDLGFYPNYSFEVGDLNGDGKFEFISMDQSGNLLRVVNLDGEVVFEKTLENNGNWGTPIFCTTDINNDGCDEIIIQSGDAILAIDGKGEVIKEFIFKECGKDDYGICIPLIGAVDGSSIIAAVAGGTIYKLDYNFNIVWQSDGFRNEYSHEMFFADIDNDGYEEIILCTVDSINHSFDPETNVGELLILDHDGSLMLRKRVDDYVKNDTHFDDIAIADFIGDGTCQILLEKGILIDLKGNVLWDLQHHMNHGQWIAYTKNPESHETPETAETPENPESPEYPKHPKHPGMICFISELWDPVVLGLIFTGQGEKISDIKNLPWPNPPEGVRILPSRCHLFGQEFFVTQQMSVAGNEFNNSNKRPYQAIGLFIDLQGNLLGELPYDDAQVEGYYYNGETHSKVVDVDSDGHPEIIYPKQDGHIMIIKKKVGF